MATRWLWTLRSRADIIDVILLAVVQDLVTEALVLVDHTDIVIKSRNLFGLIDIKFWSGTLDGPTQEIKRPQTERQSKYNSFSTWHISFIYY